MQSEAIDTFEASGFRQTALYTRNDPYAATVLVNRLLTGPTSEKETRHLELSLGWSGIQYLPGDSAGVIPENRTEAVEEVLRLTGSTGDEPVTDFHGGALDLRKALTEWLMIGKLSMSTVRGWAKLTGNAELRALVSPKNKKNFEDFLWGREFPDLAEQYPVKLEDPQQMFKLLCRGCLRGCIRFLRARRCIRTRRTSLCAWCGTRAMAGNGRESAPGSLASERRRALYCRSSSTRTISSVCPRIWMRQW